MDTWWLQFYTLCNYITDLGEKIQQMLVTKHILLFFFGQNLHFCAENVHVSLPLNFFYFLGRTFKALLEFTEDWLELFVFLKKSRWCLVNLNVLTLMCIFKSVWMLSMVVSFYVMFKAFAPLPCNIKIKIILCCIKTAFIHMHVFNTLTTLLKWPTQKQWQCNMWTCSPTSLHSFLFGKAKKKVKLCQQCNENTFAINNNKKKKHDVWV